MRILILALMIVLLPLRGWAGDAMATQMASHAIASESGASRAHESGASASFHDVSLATPECHGAMVDSAQGGEAATNGSGMGGGHSGTCEACQACHTVALSQPPIAVSSSLTSPQLLPMPALVFASATVALGQKPPIS